MADSDRLTDVHERLDEMDAAKAEATAARILHGMCPSLCFSASVVCVMVWLSTLL